MALQTFPYTVIKAENKFEVRRMNDYFVVKAHIEERLGYEGFNACFSYISGENEASQRFSMTAPVLNRLEGTTMKDTAFVLLNQSSFPRPLNETMIEQVNSRLMVVIKFKGNINNAIIEKKTQQLVIYIQQQGYTVKDGPWLARYNPPFIPGFLKRNELVMEVVDA